METLRERNTARRTAVNEYQNTVRVGERLSQPDTAPLSQPAPAAPPVSQTPDALPVETYFKPIDVNDLARFSRRFVHPDFPCKRVPYGAAKRAFDVAFASSVLLLVSPVMAAAALAVKLTSRGPLVFKQVRVGQGGRLFWCYKFRSMCVDAEQKKQMLMHLNEASGPVFKMKQDPRITPIGGLLRKFSVDELPQLFNVLKGDMSIVGPRPPIPSEVSQYTPHQRGRLAVRPGLTCLWQVNGRSNVSFERWVELDLMYIETMTFWQDMKITAKTIPAVMKGSGAH